jgi:hypothetical protein
MPDEFDDEDSTEGFPFHPWHVAEAAGNILSAVGGIVSFFAVNYTNYAFHQRQFERDAGIQIETITEG